MSKLFLLLFVLPGTVILYLHAHCKRPFGPYFANKYMYLDVLPDGVIHKPSSRLSLLSARPAVAFPASERHRRVHGEEKHMYINDWSTCEIASLMPYLMRYYWNSASTLEVIFCCVKPL